MRTASLSARLIGAGAALLLLAPHAHAQDATFVAQVNAAGAEYLASERGVGLSIGIIRDGRTTFYNFGLAAKNGRAPTSGTAYEIGSISKTITGLLLARAVIAGKASLDDDVRKYLDGAYPGLVFNDAPVRLIHLANMTSALPDNLPDLSSLGPDPGHAKHVEALRAYDKTRFLEDLRTVAPAGAPGSNVAHSNLAAQLLIYVVERIYGAPYDVILKREVETPLGFSQDSEATGYEASGNEAATLPRANFGYRYSIADMLRYAALQLNERDSAIALSHRGSWFTLDRKTWVAMPWIVSEQRDGGRQLRYSGGTWGFASVMMLYPERRLGIVLMANNASETAQGRLSEIANRLVEALGPQRSGVDTSALDKTVRLQDDFYRHVNGGWLARNDIPPYMSSWSTNFEAQVKTYEAMSTVLASQSAAQGSRDVDRRKLSDLYRSFMNEAAIEAAGITPLNAELARIAAIRTPADVAATLAHFVRLGMHTPIAFSVHADDKNPTRNMADLEQSGLGLPDRDYYLSEQPRFVQMRASYRDHGERVLALAGDAAAAGNATAVLAFETTLAKAQWTGVENRDPVKTYNHVALTALDSIAPGLDWKQFVADLGLSGKTASVNVSQPSYFSALGKLVRDTPLPVWQAYFRWRLVESLSPYLSKPFDEERVVYSRTMGGATTVRPRWLRAIGFVDDRMGDALARLYVEQHFPPAAKAHAELLVRNLLAAFRVRIHALDWMSADTKREALAKLTALSVKLGYPSVWKDYAAFRTSPTDVVGNLLRFSIFKYDRDLDRLTKPIDKDAWSMSPLSVNGSYSALRNEIVLPAALMQAPYFQPDADDAANYGGLGWFIAHEISHAFDNRGNQYDSRGNLRDWWTPEDHARFAERRKALVEQYSAYEPVPGMHLDGALSVGENLADNLGLSIAYDAYHQSLGARTPPILDGLTGDQRFFMSYARIWAGKAREATLVQAIKSDTHAPNDLRVRGAVVNQDAFYAAFGVREGDGMYLSPPQRVRIW